MPVGESRTEGQVVGIDGDLAMAFGPALDQYPVKRPVEGFDRSAYEGTAMSSDNAFFAILGAASAAGGAAILLFETPFSQMAGWFGVVSGAGLLLMLAYRLIRRK